MSKSWPDPPSDPQPDLTPEQRHDELAANRRLHYNQYCLLVLMSLARQPLRQKSARAS
jgi:hypothetical protein